jgi:hypothetical protein
MMLRFVVSLLIALLLITGVLHVGLYAGWITRSPTYYIEILLFVFFSTLILYSYLYRAASKPHFVERYLLTMVIKSLAYVAFAFAIVLKDTHGAAGNMVFFAVSYFIFISLEIGFLYRKITRQ